MSNAHLNNFEQASLSELDEDMTEDILSGKNTTGLDLKDLKALKNLEKEDMDKEDAKA